MYLFIINKTSAAPKTAKHTFITYEGKSPKVSLGCTQTNNDQIDAFNTLPWRLKSGLTSYKISYNNKPRGISNEVFKSAIDLAFSNIQGAGGGILFRYDGSSREGKPINDNNNTIMFGFLPIGTVSLTTVWTIDNKVSDIDTVFNRRYAWSLTNYTGENDCGGLRTTFDLRNIATHEFGHWAGLGDIYDQNAKDLTMYGLASRGELKKDSLGLGDINGIRAVWP